MLIIRTFKVHTYEKGLMFRDGEFVGLLGTGRHWFVDPMRKVRVDILNQREPWIKHSDLDLIVRSGALDGEAVVLDLKDTERALVWLDGRFEKILGPGLHAAWTKFRNMKVQVADAAQALQFDHPELNTILRSKSADEYLTTFTVLEGRQGVFLKDGDYLDTKSPGRYAYWKNVGQVAMHQVDMRESVLEVSGQELMTSDKVTLRLNALVSFKVIDSASVVMSVDNWSASVYREAQLVLRAAVGARDLDSLLADKDSLVAELQAMLQPRLAEFGVKLLSFGIKDIILPGDMKELMNKVIEARKAAQANLISRQEETAAMRSQANTAKLLEANPVLMRLRELEVLEKIAAGNKLNVVLGEKGLTDRMMHLL